MARARSQRVLMTRQTHQHHCPYCKQLGLMIRLNDGLHYYCVTSRCRGVARKVTSSWKELEDGVRRKSR